jgi:hypothetical protein
MEGWGVAWETDLMRPRLTSPFGKGGLRGILSASLLWRNDESPLPPFSKGGNHGFKWLTLHHWHAKEG